MLHMSRNNVLYHIGNAADLIGIPLDCHENRFGLLVAYRLLGLCT